jgi:beta-lactamase superfamily II metal-dependent hydrolase
MFCEIEFWPVGSGAKPGDAIIVRYGSADAFELMIVDGGTQQSGEEVVRHIRGTYGATAVVSHVVLTHADGDHASGLREILRQLPVRNLWLNAPWAFAADALALFNDRRLIAEGLEAKLKSEYEIVAEIFDLAIEHRVDLYFATQGSQVGPFRILSPSRFHYACLLPQFDRTPEPNQAALEILGMWIDKASALDKILGKLVEGLQGWTKESWSAERLKDGGKTSASNESSVILYGAFEGGRNVLLTGDAGVRALTWAADYADSLRLPLQQFNFVQVPHHGSRRNVGPTILDRILGHPVPEGTERFTAFVSAPPDDVTHPRQIVVNAFKRRGARVASTKGNNIVHWGGFPARTGYTDLTFLPFAPDVEEYD